MTEARGFDLVGRMRSLLAYVLDSAGGARRALAIYWAVSVVKIRELGGAWGQC